MLTINIVNGNADGSLDFEVNGSPNNGNNSAKRTWKVHWKVKNHDSVNVDYIHSIEMKTGPGAPSSTDIFSNDPPASQSNRKHWRGKVNGNAPTCSEYNYDIKWVKKGETQIRTYDPKITVMPSSFAPIPLLAAAVSIILAFFSWQLFRRKMKRK